MRQLRKLLTVSVLVGLVAISCAAALHVVRQGFPDLKADDHSELREQLTSTDLAQASDETTLALARHLEQELRRGVDWQREIDSLDERQWGRFQKNLPLIMWTWFQGEVDAYIASPQDERKVYLEGRIDGIMSWRALNRLRSTAARSAAPGSRLRTLEDGLIETARKGLATEPPERQQQIREFILALQLIIFEQAGDRMVPVGF